METFLEFENMMGYIKVQKINLRKFLRNLNKKIEIESKGEKEKIIEVVKVNFMC